MKAILLCLLAVSLPCFGQTDTNQIAAGDWSPIVRDNRGHSLRGRFVVYDDRGQSAASHARIYLELQQPFQGAWEGPIEINYDLGLHNILHFEMRNASGQPIAQTPTIMRGPMPSPVSITIPCDATIRLRSDNYIMGPTKKPDGLEVLVMGGCWIIPANPTNEYYLSATFAPEKAEATRTNWNQWQGTLNLPHVRIPAPAPSH